MYTENRRIILSFLFATVGAFVILAWTCFTISDQAAIANNFEECVAIGNPVMETQPRRCQSAGVDFAELNDNVPEGFVLTLN